MTHPTEAQRHAAYTVILNMLVTVTVSAGVGDVFASGVCVCVSDVGYVRL